MYVSYSRTSGPWSRKTKSKLIAAIARKVATAIRINARELGHPCTVLHDCVIDLSRAAKKARYPHLIVLTSVSMGNDRTTKLLRVEFDDGDRTPRLLLEKMVGTPGYGVVICPGDYRFDKYFKPYKSIAEKETIVMDGIFFVTLPDVLLNGLLGATFTSPDGSRVKFRTI